MFLTVGNVLTHKNTYKIEKKRFLSFFKLFQGISVCITFKCEFRTRILRIHFLRSSQHHVASPLDTKVS